MRGLVKFGPEADVSQNAGPGDMGVHVTSHPHYAVNDSSTLFQVQYAPCVGITDADDLLLKYSPGAIHGEFSNHQQMSLGVHIFSSDSLKKEMFVFVATSMRSLRHARFWSRDCLANSARVLVYILSPKAKGKEQRHSKLYIDRDYNRGM